MPSINALMAGINGPSINGLHYWLSLILLTSLMDGINGRHIYVDGINGSH
jgi:hypothetical protein